jgi:hypothetical protein
LTNPHASEQPVRLALRENQNVTIQDYCNLFRELIVIVNSLGMVLCSIVVDNLPVEVSGLDRGLQLSDSPVIHVECLAHMENLFSVTTVSTPNVSWTMDYLADLQKLLTSPPATVQLGAKCPKFVRTRRFDMLDTLRCISKHFTPVSEFLCHLPDGAAFPRSLPQEIFELYLVLLPFSCFTKPVERRSSSLPEIALFCRGLLATLRESRGMICSSVARAIFRDMHSRLFGQLM